MMDYNISTQTFVVYSDEIVLDLDKVFDMIPVTENIIGVKYGSKLKGEFKTYSSLKNQLKCLTVAMKIDDIDIFKKTVGKSLSIKLFNNGSVQVTGCRGIRHVTRSIDIIYKYLRLTELKSLHFVSVMMNANFDIGFKINRDRLSNYLTDICKINIPPITTGYMGIKLRIRLVDACNKILIPRMSWTVTDGFVELPSVMYSQFFSDNIKKKEKQFVACIGIFQNGKILISGVNDQAIDFTVNWVKETLNKARHVIEIKKKAIKTFKRE